MFRLSLLLFFATCATIVNGQVSFSAKKLPQAPSGLKFRGKLQEAWKWKDSLGDNVLILSATDIYWNSGEDASSIQLFAYHYCKKDTGYRVLWRLNDMIENCPVDIKAAFLKGSTSITDLDKDGVAETTVQYRLVCRGDVSPADMKLIMHEDTVKYALRGMMWTPLATADPSNKKLPITEKDVNLETLPGYKGPDDDYDKAFGRYKSERDFLKAPSSFLQFARKQWLKFVVEPTD
jgi:hypothetical protein